MQTSKFGSVLHKPSGSCLSGAFDPTKLTAYTLTDAIVDTAKSTRQVKVDRDRCRPTALPAGKGNQMGSDSRYLQFQRHSVASQEAQLDL